MRPVEVALDAAARGWYVFPCKEAKYGEKHKAPWTKNGHLDATTDAGKIREWWKKRPGALIGIDCGRSGIIVADVDSADGHGGPDGYETWSGLRATAPEVEDTTLVETFSGGLHAYYQANGHRVQCDNKGERLGPGIHVKAQGGYVIAGGSEGYEYVEGHGPEKLAGLPESLSTRLSYARAPTPIIPPEALTIPQGSRNAALASLGGTMRKRGMSHEAILAALLAENEEKCKPPLPAPEVAAIAKSVSRYAPAAPDEPDPEQPKDEHEVDLAEFFIQFPEFWKQDHIGEEWVYPGVLAKGRSHALYAVHKAGKSLFMLWLALQLARQNDYVVVYLDYEMGESDVYERLLSMGCEEEDIPRLRYATLPALSALDTKKDAVALVEILDRVQALFPACHLVVFIDTLARAVAGEENDADTYRDFYRETGQRIKRRQYTSMRADHAGKDVGKGQRGSSSKGDDVDVIARLIPTLTGFKVHRDAARMSWIPEEVEFEQKDECGVLTFTRKDQVYPEGTGEIANLLDRLGLPLTVKVGDAAKALRAAGDGRRTERVSAAIRWRKEAEKRRCENLAAGSGNGSGNAGNEVRETEPETMGNEALFSLGNRDGKRRETDSAASGKRGSSLREAPIPAGTRSRWGTGYHERPPHGSSPDRPRRRRALPSGRHLRNPSRVPPRRQRSRRRQRHRHGRHLGRDLLRRLPAARLRVCALAGRGHLMARPQIVGICTACASDDRCAVTFRCRTCGHERNVCRDRVGGFSKHGPGECTACMERRVFGPAWVRAWAAERKGRLKVAEVKRIVAEAQKYQEDRKRTVTTREAGK